MAKFLDIIYLIAGIISGIGGIYYLIFAKKIAQNVKPNSKQAILSIEDRIKKIRIAGVCGIVIFVIAMLQLT